MIYNTHMKKVVLLLLFALQLVFCSHNIFAAENNKFGIHLAVPSDEDLQKASELVNSSGGEYGYVTIVVQDDRLDLSYWQSVFDKLRKLKLIPIVRIATHPEGEVWKAPTESDASKWVEMFQKINWVTKDRYVILYNEPNHAAEWGGAVDPAQYGKVAASHARALKLASPDYKVMLAGVDLSAPEARTSYADAYTFLSESTKSFCEYLKTSDTKPCSEYVDAISSHAYPNPGFIGSPYGEGRKSIRGYETEISWFKEFFGGKELPVYITETGWDGSKLSEQSVSSYFDYAYRNIWLKDNRVKAVTPFILNYQGQPFLGFSLLELGSLSPKLQFITLQGIPKTKGEPDILDKARITGNLPNDYVELGRSIVQISVNNIGQKNWDNPVEYSIRVSSSPYVLSGQASIPTQIETFKSTSVYVPIYSQDVDKNVPGMMKIQLVNKKDEIVGEMQKTFVLHPQPSLNIKASILSKGLSTASDFELQIFDENEKLVYRSKSLELVLGRTRISQLSNVVPGKTYRFVLLKPYYLPRQTKLKVANGENMIEFDQMLPLDMDKDGALTLGDVQGLFMKRNNNDFGIIEKINLFLPYK
ncbi:MAG: hypothetical protein U0525_01695 [Patescibacteria group bacterium]